MISIIIVHFATPETLVQTVAALIPPGLESGFQVIVVDNASLGPLGQPMSELFPGARFIFKERNVGFGSAANEGVRAAQGGTLLFLNGDCFVTREQIAEMTRVVQELPEMGAVGFRQVTSDGWPQLTFGEFPTLRSEWRRHRLQMALDRQRAPWAREKINGLGQEPFEVDWVSGSCLWVSRAVFERVGGFDEKFFLYFEDIDLCRRIQQSGRRIYHSPRPQVLHLHGASAATCPQEALLAYRRSQLHFARKHYPSWQVMAVRGYLAARALVERALTIAERSLLGSPPC